MDKLYYKLNKINFDNFRPLTTGNFDISIVNSITSFEHLINILLSTNNTYRRGFKQTPIIDNIASHMYRVSLYALYINEHYKLQLSTNKLLIYALIHDISEVYIGDTTPSDNVNTQYRHDVEHLVFKKMFSQINFFQKMYQQYQEQLDDESKLIKLLDKFDFFFALNAAKNQAMKKEKKQIIQTIINVKISLTELDNLIINKTNINNILLNIHADILKSTVDKITT